MAVQVKLSGVKQISNTSLTSIVEFTNFNINLIASAVQDFLRSIDYVEGADSVSVEISSIDSDVVQIRQKLSVLGSQLNNGTFEEVIRLEPTGSVIAKNVLANDVLQGLRLRLKVFGQVPPVGVPGEVIYIQEQPGYVEGFYGYLVSRGWVCLSCGDNDSSGGTGCCCNKENIIYTNANLTSGDGSLVSNSLSIGLVPALGTGFMLFVNGVQMEIGDGTKVAPVYLSDDNGATALHFYEATPNAAFYWNASQASFDLETSDRLTMRYIAIDPTCGTGTTTTTTTLAPLSTTTTTQNLTTTTTVFVTTTTIPCQPDTIVHIQDPANPNTIVTFTGTPVGPYQVNFVDAYGSNHVLTSFGNIIMPWVFDLSNPYYAGIPTITGVYNFIDVATGCTYTKYVGVPMTTTTTAPSPTTSAPTTTTTTAATTTAATTTPESTTTTTLPSLSTTTTIAPGSTTTTTTAATTTVPCQQDTIVYLQDQSNPNSRVTFTGTPSGPYQVNFVDDYGTPHTLTEFGNIVMPWVFDLSNPYYVGIPTVVGVYSFTDVATGCVYTKSVGISSTTTTTDATTTTTQAPHCTPETCLEITIQAFGPEPAVVQYVDCNANLQQIDINPDETATFCYCQDGGWGAVAGDVQVTVEQTQCPDGFPTTTTTTEAPTTTTTTEAPTTTTTTEAPTTTTTTTVLEQVLPDALSSLTAWYKPETFTSNSGTWLDASGNGHTMQRQTSPAPLTNTLSGYDCPSGHPYYSNSSGFVGATSLTWIIVGKVTAGNWIIRTTGYPGGPAANFGLYHGGGSPSYLSWYGRDAVLASNTTIMDTDVPISTAGPQIMVATYDIVTDKFMITWGGGTWESITPWTPLNYVGPIQFGNLLGTDSILAEIVMYADLKDSTELNQVCNYLADKYALSWPQLT